MESHASTSNGASTDLETRNWLELPLDVMAAILERVGSIDVLENVQKVCTTWRRICKEPSMWRTIDMQNPEEVWHFNPQLEKMCMHAVDLSHGQLLHLNLAYFGSDELLLHVSNRSSQLRHLQLVFCDNVSDHGLSEVVNNLPLLEELHLYYISITKETLEVVGRCCPLLKSFKFNNRGSRLTFIECDEDAIAIAENMPGLCHLQLFGNRMTNDGLVAILNGCPHLESLDLRQCFNVSLSGNVGRRCFEQIKDLRSPQDSTEDYGFDADFDDSESFDDDFPWFSDIDMRSDDDGDYEFSGGSDYSDFEDMFIG